MILAFFLLLLQVTTPVTIVLDDAHAAVDGILGYRWTVDGATSSSKIKKTPPCVSCLERTFNMQAGSHAVRVVPYTAKGDLTRDTVMVTVDVTIAGDESERTITLKMKPGL